MLRALSFNGTVSKRLTEAKMNVEMVARNIQIILAPVVMVTACAILVQGLLGRYAAITDRLRALVSERLALLYSNRASEASDGSLEEKLRRERLALIDNQLPILASHHRRTHDAVLAVYSAVAVFVVDMFAIALAAVYELQWLANDILLLFLAGTAVLLFGVLTASLEIRTSHQVLQDEVTRVRRLNLTQPSGPTSPTASPEVVPGPGDSHEYSSGIRL
jgi:hypothetical protein